MYNLNENHPSDEGNGTSVVLWYTPDGMIYNVLSDEARGSGTTPHTFRVSL